MRLYINSLDRKVSNNIVVTLNQTILINVCTCITNRQYTDASQLLIQELRSKKFQNAGPIHLQVHKKILVHIHRIITLVQYCAIILSTIAIILYFAILTRYGSALYIEIA
jgi:hypothetical protein